MLLSYQVQHRILGRMYTDDQLFRIIVPKRFTLHAYPPASQVKAGFCEQILVTSGDIKPEFTDEDIALVLQYRWPEDFEDFRACDIDFVNNSVKGVGNNLEPDVDILNYDNVTLSYYCHEQLYDNKARREQILNDFKTELHEARRLRAAAVEERFKHTEPEVLQYIFIAKVHHALSWDSIAVSLNRSYRRPAGLMSHVNAFDAGLVEEIFQIHAEARTAMFEECLRRDWKRLSLTKNIGREARSRRFSPVTPAAETSTEYQGEDLGS